MLDGNNLAASLAKNFIAPVHKLANSRRRIKRLSAHFNTLIPIGVVLRGLDVGCGDGQLARLIQTEKPLLDISGIDVLVREETAISVKRFDGANIPFPDKSFDFTMLADVLHHADDPQIVLRECARVSRQFILIKDHTCEMGWDETRLRFMDWVGNKGYGVSLPYSYLSGEEWTKVFNEAGVSCVQKLDALRLYPGITTKLFDDNLHFIAKLSVNS